MSSRSSSSPAAVAAVPSVQTERSLGVAGALALGAAGLLSADPSFAVPDVPACTGLCVTNQNLVLTAFESDSIDLDGDRMSDVTFSVGFEGKGAFVKPMGRWQVAIGENGAQRFLAGDTIGPGIDTAWGGQGESALLYSNNSGSWAALGSTGFVGLRQRRDDGDGRGKTAPLNYAWIEVTRGSIIIGQSGYQTVAGVGAVTPVPEPGSLAMFAAGAAGLLALRKRRQRQARADA